MRIITRKDVAEANDKRVKLLKEIEDLEQNREEVQAQLSEAQIQVQRLQAELTPVQLTQVQADVHKARKALYDLNNDIEKKKRLLNELPEDGDVNNTYIQKVQGYIPAAIVAAYVSIDQLIKSATNIPTTLVYTVVFVILLVLTPIYVWRGTTQKVKSKSCPQITVATISFILWVFALGGPFTTFSWYQSFYGGLALVFYTLLVPLFIQTD